MKEKIWEVIVLMFALCIFYMTFIYPIYDGVVRIIEEQVEIHEREHQHERE